MKEKLKLKDVTLIAVASTEIDMTQLAMRISSQNIDFSSIKLLSSALPKKTYPEIEYISIPQMTFVDYNRLIIEDLHKYFKTTHCLIVQADSFVVDSTLWKKEFLKFDYIGGPWPNKIQVNPDLLLNLEKNPVGNGGFSLRSRKLVEATSKIKYDSLKFPMKAEDVIICHFLYEEMISAGIRFAPAELAAKFSMENESYLYGQDVNNVFGFHGKHIRSYFMKKYILRTSIGEW